MITLLCAAAVALAQDPTVRVAGERVPDPHRWLERLDAPEVAAWVSARDATARAWTGQGGLEEALYAWVLGWRTAPPTPRRRLLAEGGERQLWAHSTWSQAPGGGPGALGSWHTSLEVLGPGGARTLTVPGLDPRAQLCAWSLHPEGRAVAWGRALLPEEPELCWLYLTELEGGTTRPVFVGRGLSVGLAPDARRLVVAHTEGRGGVVEELTWDGERLGARLRSASPLVVGWLPDGQVIALTAPRAGSPPSKAPAHTRVAWGTPASLRWLSLPAAHYGFVGWDGRSLLLRTDHQAPAQRVVGLDPARPRAWVDWVAQDPTAPLVLARLAGRRLLLARDRDGLYRLSERAIGPDGRPEAEERSLGITATGRISLSTAGGHALIHAPVLQSAGVWRLTDTGPPQPLVSPTPGLEVHTELARSADGTELPLTVLRPAGAAADAPVWLQVYGGFGEVQRARWDPTVAFWSSLGGVFAVVHARGGNERGVGWHEAAVGVNKVRTVEDVRAAAAYFVARGTPPGRIVVQGMSNGGLIVAAAVAAQPALFGAAVAESGVYDLLRGPRLGRWWPWEYGHPRGRPALQDSLRALSPVHGTPAGPLPPLLLVTGREDPVVSPAHSLKLAAAWAAHPGGPVLLRVEPWTSHADAPLGPTQEAAERAWAAYMAFVLRALGLGWDPAAEEPTPPG